MDLADGISYHHNERALTLTILGVDRDEQGLIVDQIKQMKYPRTAIRKGWQPINEETFKKNKKYSEGKWKVHLHTTTGCYHGAWGTQYHYYTVDREEVMVNLLLKIVPSCREKPTMYSEWI
jgi:hypothetical protein